MNYSQPNSAVYHRFFTRLLIVPVVFLTIILPLSKGQASERHKNCLWTLTAGTNTIYLLGSLHILKSDAYPLAKPIEAAYSDSQMIVFETDIEQMNSPAVQSQMLMQGFYQNNQSLADHISPEAYAKINARVTDLGLTMAQFDRMKPWLGALMLTMSEFQRLGFKPEYGIDNHFFHRAKQDAKSIVYLEPVQYQIDLLTQMVPENQEAFLEQSLRDLSLIETRAPQLVEAWETGDTKVLQSIILASFHDYPAVYDQFILDRNRNWLNTIETWVDGNRNVMIIVGAGHLVGDDGIIALLKSKGYIVQQK